MIEQTRAGVVSDVIDRLIGVIDLQDGRAVHGVGGKRDQYHPVSHFRDASGVDSRIDGDALRLIECYRASGIQSFYIADLDGIRRARWQRDLVRTIAARCGSQCELYLDLGLRRVETGADQSWIESLIADYPKSVLVIATECAPATTLVESLHRFVPNGQLAVSFDYRDGIWMSETTSESQWIAACQQRAVGSVIALDLASVGGRSIDRPLELCKRIGARLDPLPYITGGGIRCMRDAQRLLRSGADRLLVASLFVDAPQSVVNDDV